MDRRELLRTLGATAALAGLTPGQLSALLEASASESLRTGRGERAFFTTEQREAVDAMAEAIIPATDTPGALDAGVTDFIEIIVSEWYGPVEREEFMRGLAHLDDRSVVLTGVRFAYAGDTTQTAVLAGLEAEGAALLPGAVDGPRPFFHQFRSLVLIGYYNSEVGMRDELMFRRIPGRFDGCADLAEVAHPVTGGERG